MARYNESYPLTMGHRKWNMYCVLKGLDPLEANLNHGLEWPPMARYSSNLNVDVVLDYLRELTPLSQLSLKLLSFKTVMLLLLCTCSRQQRLLNDYEHHCLGLNKSCEPFSVSY